jgi:beta-glucanase (GH16 family)
MGGGWTGVSLVKGWMKRIRAGLAAGLLVVGILCWHVARGEPGAASSPLQATPTTADAPAKSIHPFGDDPTLRDYRLSFSDEFDGDALDTDVWAYRTGYRALSMQVPENVSVSGGFLHLAVKKEDIKSLHYTAAGIISKKEFTYGYYECRFKIPPGKGWHTSFWTMLNRVKGQTPPRPLAQEIDICEQDSVDHHKYSAGVIAWANHKAGLGRKYPHVDVDLSEDFHIWGAEYTPTVVRFFFDGKFTHETDVSKIVQGAAEHLADDARLSPQGDGR